MRAAGRLGADRDADHPPAIEGGRREIGGTRAVDPLGPGARVPVEVVARQALRLVADAHGLEWHRGEYAPTRGRGDPVGEPPRVFEVAAEAGAQAAHPLGPD